MAAPKVVTPGENVGSSTTHNAGYGVYVRGEHLIATVVGTPVVQPSEEKGKKPTLRVSSAKHRGNPPPIPHVASIVTAKVTKVTPRAATVEILVVNGRPLKELFKGSIRQQDVRQSEIDKVEIYKCFAPGDIVKAEVISLGDRHSYQLSTAKNGLGVVYARGPAGVRMVPVSWQEMQCPVSKVREFRKVAKEEQ